MAAVAFFAAANALAQPGTARLDDVVVTATRFAEPARTLPLGVSVITAEDIRESGAATINEAIMRLLGVPGRQDFYGGGDYALDLRGFGETAASNQVIVLDGIRLNEADLSGTRLAGISIESVDRIEVLRGSGAVLYGEGATGGVIVITTRAGAGKARRNTASAYAAAGSHQLRELRADATVAAAGFSLDVAGAKRDSDNHRDNFRSEFDAASATVQWRGDGLRLGASHARDDLSTGLPGALTPEQYAADPRQAGSQTDRASIRNTRDTLFGEARLGAWELGLDLGRRDKKFASSWNYQTEAQNRSLRARRQGSVLGARNVLVLGTDHGRWEHSFGSEQSTHAWYVRDELTLPGSETRLSTGWRTERIDKITFAGELPERQHAWELGLSQPLTAGLTVYGRLGRSFRLPNVDEVGFTLPATELRPQTSRDVEAGARWAHAAGRIEARLYRSSLDDEIGYDPTQPNPNSWNGFGANVNFDATRRQGLELEATHALGRTIALSGHAALRSSSFRAGPHAGQDVPLAPARTLALRTDWQAGAGHRLSGGLSWVSWQHPGGDFDNRFRMPSYLTADARYAWQWQQAEFALGVTNLFDRKHYTQAFLRGDGATLGIYPEAGRTVTASARVRF
ncbi:TonB-dependent receptor [Caldimonas tepidiphila]|uniref:TonB-dependent receptor n=1 Tax=Caldimonas tepidiphila TaxID=2315841 RepID=UPI001F0BFD82|nr:TonB-dependent receptor [Caldimonas tepidiphila]